MLDTGLGFTATPKQKAKPRVKHGATGFFEKAFGIKADTLLRMQAAYDLAQARIRKREIVVDRVAA